MDDEPPTTSLDNDWCSVNEAARRLGVTATAIRNRIKRGTLDTRPNGNFGRLVRVPRTVTLTPKEPVPGTVPLTPQERVTLTVLADHVTTLKAALAKLEAEAKRERERAEAESRPGRRVARARSCPGRGRDRAGVEGHAREVGSHEWAARIGTRPRSGRGRDRAGATGCTLGRPRRARSRAHPRGSSRAAPLLAPSRWRGGQPAQGWRREG